jgi:hypothetical protein
MAVAAIQASPTAPDPSARPRLLLATRSSSSFPCHHLFPSHDVAAAAHLLGPAGSSSPTRSHPIHQPGSRVPLPLRTLSSSSFAAAGTSFEKRSIDLVDHGRYGAAHPRASGMATRSAAASKREGRRSQQQLDPVSDKERAGADDRHVSPNLSQPHASPSLRLSLNNTQNPSSIPTLPGVRAPTTRLRPDLPSRAPGWGRRWRCHGRRVPRLPRRHLEPNPPPAFGTAALAPAAPSWFSLTGCRSSTRWPPALPSTRCLSASCVVPGSLFPSQHSRWLTHRTSLLSVVQSPPLVSSIATSPCSLPKSPPPLTPPLPCARRATNWLGYRRRPTEGVEAFTGLFIGHEHPPGTPSSSLCILLCKTEHPNPLGPRLSGYAMRQ